MIGGLLIAGVMAPISIPLIMPDIFITLCEHMENCKLKYRFGTCKWFVLNTLKCTVNIVSSDYLISELGENVVRILVIHSYLNDTDNCRICIPDTSIVMEEYHFYCNGRISHHHPMTWWLCFDVLLSQSTLSVSWLHGLLEMFLAQ
jgi:hypothetical protein